MSYTYEHGSGTEQDPYQVWTAEDLDGVRDYLSAHFIQMADIGLGVSPWNSGDGWLPISTFTGTYDFNNFSINNLTINRPSTNNVGLFGKTGNGAVLLKPKLVNVSIIAYDYVGSLVGCVDDITQIINCSVSGNISGNDCIGGIVGCAYDVLMEQCFVSKGSTVSGMGWDIGGLIGSFEYGYSYIKNCYARCHVEGEGDVGGLIGYSAVESPYGMINCYFAGTLNSSYPEYSGGIFGYLSSHSDLIVNNTYYNSEKTGLSGNNYGALPRTTAEMTYPYFNPDNTYVGWDFNKIWAHDTTGKVNNGYPYLKWQEPPKVPKLIFKVPYYA